MTIEKNVALDAEGLATSAGSFTVYNYQPLTGLYNGSSQEYLVQGLGIPAHSTSYAPPANVSGKVCVFTNGQWKQVEDHRGETVYSIATGEAVTVTLPGEYPAGTTLLKPATAFDKWGGAAWVTDTAAQRQAIIDAAQAEKNARVSEAGSVTQVWQTQVALGIIIDTDRASLIAWMKYLQAVQAVDVSTAPDIDWPVRPQ